MIIQCKWHAVQPLAYYWLTSVWNNHPIAFMIIFRYVIWNHFSHDTKINFITYNFTQIYDGPNAASKLIGTYCNAEQLIQMESTTHTVFIRLVTDVNNEGRGFELRFNASKKWISVELGKIILIEPFYTTSVFYIFRLQTTNSWYARCNR